MSLFSPVMSGGTYSTDCAHHPCSLSHSKRAVSRMRLHFIPTSILRVRSIQTYGRIAGPSSIVRPDCWIVCKSQSALQGGGILVPSCKVAARRHACVSEHEAGPWILQAGSSSLGVPVSPAAMSKCPGGVSCPQRAQPAHVYMLFRVPGMECVYACHYERNFPMAVLPYLTNALPDSIID